MKWLPNKISRATFLRNLFLCAKWLLERKKNLEITYITRDKTLLTLDKTSHIQTRSPIKLKALISY